MTYYFNPDDFSFYNSVIHSDIPTSAKLISDDVFQEMQNRDNDEKIDTDKAGLPIRVKIDNSSESLIYSNCTPAQGLVALFALKQITEDDVQTAIDSITDAVQKYTAQIAFKRAVTWDRNSQTMQTMAKLLALSEKDLDELFSYAVTIQA